MVFEEILDGLLKGEISKNEALKTILVTFFNNGNKGNYLDYIDTAVSEIEKLNKIKIPKEKGVCNCGQPARFKKMCKKCYEKNAYKINKTKKISLDVSLDDDIFKILLQEINNGKNISEACKDIGISRTFYSKNASYLQKKELSTCKAINRYNYFMK